MAIWEKSPTPLPISFLYLSMYFLCISYSSRSPHSPTIICLVCLWQSHTVVPKSCLRFFFFQMPLPPLLKAVPFSLHLLLFIHLPQRLLLHDAFQFLQTASPSLQQPPPPPPFSWLYLISCSCSWKSK